MAKKNDRKKQPPPPSLSHPNFSAPPAPAANHPPLSGPVSNPNVKGKGKGKAKAKDQSSARFVEPPIQPPTQPPNPPNAQLQAPVRWVYNYDHTDPLNFGFMFPVTPDSSTDLSIPSAHPMSSSITPVVPAPTRGPVGNYPSSPIQVHPESSAWGQLQWSLSPGESEDQQFTGSQQQTPSSAFHQHQHFPHQSLPHRYSQNRDISQTSSSQQLAPSEDQVW
jgi:hypothetical protein